MMPASLLPGIENISWFSVRLHLAPTFPLGQDEPALVVLNALIKSIQPKHLLEERLNLRRKDPEAWSQVQEIQSRWINDPPLKLAFHVPGKRAPGLRRKKGEPLDLEVCIFGATEAQAEDWLALCDYYLKHHPNARHQSFSEPEIIRHCGSELLLPFEDLPAQAELEFLSPLPFPRTDSASNTHLDLSTFLQGLQSRVKSLFDLDLPIPRLEGVEFQSTFWEYMELRHASKSQPGHTQYFNGCVGSLYIQGSLMSLLPWLRMAAAFHAGHDKLRLNPLGYCQLHLPARPHFDPLLHRVTTWLPALEKVQEAHDDWADQLTREEGIPFDPKAYCARIMGGFTHRDWTPAPTLAFSVPKRGGTRRLEKFPLPELVLSTGLHNLLRDPLDRRLEPSSMAYRPGRSVRMALERVESLLGQGCRFVVQADIEDFFPSVDLDRLDHLLDQALPPGDEELRRILGRLVRTPYLENGQLHSRTRGLAQGNPLSPLLANLYLDGFDEVLGAAGAGYVRYADDFVILAGTREEAEAHLAMARESLAELGLELGETKTAIKELGDRFSFLGRPFGGSAAEAVLELLVSPVRKTVYITEPGCFLGVNGDALEVRKSGRPVETIPLRRVGDIVVLNHASFSTGLVRKCARLGIPLVFTLDSGYHVASLTPDSKKFHEIAQAQARHDAALSPTERLALAKAFAKGKIQNYKPLITSRYQAGCGALLKELDCILAAIDEAADTQAIRGHEGQAAKKIFKTLNSYLKVPEFTFRKRDRHASDPMNSLFNFGYYLLFSRLNTLVRGAGLNPYLGYLHDGDDTYESLVCDIEELFRAPVDRMLISLVNLQIIQVGDFRSTSRGLRLQPEALKRFLLRFEAMLHEETGGLSLSRAMEAQVDCFRRYLSEGAPPWFFRYSTKGQGKPPVGSAPSESQP